MEICSGADSVAEIDLNEVMKKVESVMLDIEVNNGRTLIA